MVCSKLLHSASSILVAQDCILCDSQVENLRHQEYE